MLSPAGAPPPRSWPLPIAVCTKVDEQLATAPSGTSVVVQQRFPSARVVKSLNQLGYYEFEESRRAPGVPGRIAGLQLVDRLGFDAVDAGGLEAGLALQPDGSSRDPIRRRVLLPG
jgi:predicted dinucleotide-binding enzyme